MAKEVIKKVIRYDDLELGESGKKVLADETIEFSYEGSYEIDLCAENAAEFKEFMATHIRFAKKRSRGPRKPKEETSNAEEVHDLEISFS